ncbi:MAG: isocitrate lyase/PEP mutase family protein [Nitriliruptoraceae bacterium]
MGRGGDLRDVLARGDTVVAPGVFDAIGAKLVQHLGFPAVYMGGWTTGTHLGVTEPLLTMTEQVEAARRASDAVALPLIVDANAGFGEPMHTQRTVRSFEQAGIAAIHIEDQHHPKRAHYHKGVEDITSREDFLEKIKTAVQARRDDDFFIIARTDAAKARNGDVDEAIWRCNAALEVGADAVMPLVTPAVPKLDSLKPEEDLDQIRAGLPDDAHVVVLSGYLPGQRELSAAAYRARGFDIVLYPIAPVLVSLGALEQLYRPLAENDCLPHDHIGFDVAEIPRIQRLAEELLGFDALIALEEETVERHHS